MRDLPSSQSLRLLAEHTQRRPLDETVVAILAVETERLPQADGRIRDDSHVAQRIVRRAVQHQRVQQKHIARVSGRLDVPIARRRLLLLATTATHRIEPSKIAFRAERRVVSWHHARADALRVVVQVARDGTHSRGIEHGAAASGRDIGEEGDDEKALLGRVEVVDEEITVDVPALEGLGGIGLVLAGWGAKVHDEGVTPLLGGWVDAVLGRWGTSRLGC